MFTEQDSQFMDMAVALALRGEGHTGPNPMVGAVIVKDGKVIGQGWHRTYGGLHAEREALASCTGDPAGATMYVTLEPCCHHGKQPPCTDAIVSSGISRVVAGMSDPNPLVSGKGAEYLRDQGIEVCLGLHEERIRHLNRVFVKYITTRRPWVVFKTAMTLDGRIASCSGDSKWVTGETARRMVQELRGRYMGIMAGIGTVLADDPMLNCRLEGSRQPVRLVVASRAEVPVSSRIVRSAGEYRTMVAHTSEARAEVLDALRLCGVELLECKADERGYVDAWDLLGRLGNPEGGNLPALDSLLLEGGSELAWSFVGKDLVDEYFVFMAPKVIGGRAAKSPVGGEGFSAMADALPVEVESVSKVGDDWLVHGYSKSYKKCLQV